MLGNGAWLIEILARQRHEELLYEAEGERLCRRARANAKPQPQPTRGHQRDIAGAVRRGGAEHRAEQPRLRGPIEEARL